MLRISDYYNKNSTNRPPGKGKLGYDCMLRSGTGDQDFPIKILDNIISVEE